MINNLLWTQGIAIALFWILLGMMGYWTHNGIVFFAVIGFLFSLYFFRNPERICKETNPSILVCPADGRVVAVDYDKENGFEGYARKVSIFLSPLDVHVQWVPYGGTVKHITYRKGQFIAAYVPKSSEYNERNDVEITTPTGDTFLVRQIAGMVARRICWWIKPGDILARGEKYGMIRFGSRVDILLPAHVKINVCVGEYVYGGQTVLGKWL